MDDWRVKKTGKDSDSEITSLCGETVAAKATAISDITPPTTNT